MEMVFLLLKKCNNLQNFKLLNRSKLLLILLRLYSFHLEERCFIKQTADISVWIIQNIKYLCFSAASLPKSKLTQ